MHNHIHAINMSFQRIFCYVDFERYEGKSYFTYLIAKIYLFNFYNLILLSTYLFLTQKWLDDRRMPVGIVPILRLIILNLV